MDMEEVDLNSSVELEEGHKLNSMGIVSNIIAGDCHG